VTRPVSIPGYRLKDGKVERDIKRLSISKQLQIKSSKRIKVARRQVRP
jgi:hypothetical protein